MALLNLGLLSECGEWMNTFVTQATTALQPAGQAGLPVDVPGISAGDFGESWQGTE